jgi:general stress protein YciG
METKRTQERKMMGRKTVDYVNFIAVWNASSSLEEVAEKLGLSRQTCSQRAHRVRLLGHNLKTYTKPKGDPYWKHIGKMGGSALTLKPKGFEAMTPEQRTEAGKKGGAISRKTNRISRRNINKVKG